MFVLFLIHVCFHSCLFCLCLYYIYFHSFMFVLFIHSCLFFLFIHICLFPFIHVYLHFSFLFFFFTFNNLFASVSPAISSQAIVGCLNKQKELNIHVCLFLFLPVKNISFNNINQFLITCSSFKPILFMFVYFSVHSCLFFVFLSFSLSLSLFSFFLLLLWFWWWLIGRIFLIFVILRWI